MTIVGIVKTLRHNAVVEDARAEMYLPHAQLPASVGSPGRGMAVVIRTDSEPLALTAAFRDAVRAIDRNLPISDLKTMEAIAADALAAPRFAAVLLSVFAALALALAIIGTYATISLLVAERAHEIGIRMALGAARRSILGSVLREGLALGGAGIAAGVAGAFLLSRVLETLLYGVTALDPLTFAIVPVALGVVATMAALLPARRAASVDPVNTLRRG
jgi:putative ABC transport system permease protein